MTERELARWFNYAGRKMLPTQRLELYLAQLCLITARGPLQDSNELTIEDFIFNFEETDGELDEEENLAAMREALGWQPLEKG